MHLRFLVTFLQARLDIARKTKDKGQSSLEYAIIAAVAVAIAAALVLVIKNVVDRKADTINGA